MTLRKDLRLAASASDPVHLRQAVKALLEDSPGTATTEFAAKQIAELCQRIQVPEIRLAVLSSFTIDTLEPHLRVHEFLAGRQLVFNSVPYHQWYGALSSPSELCDFAPSAIFLLLHLEDVAPILAKRHLANPSQVSQEVDQLAAAIRSAVESFRQDSGAPIVLCTFIAAERGVERFFDRREAYGRQAAIDDLNARLTLIARDYPNIYVFDYAQAVADFGRLSWFDAVKDHHVKAPVASKALPALAQEVSAFLHALVTPRSKVLAVDADNTLWGGIVGEDGVEELALGGEYPGNAFVDFQSFLSNLRGAGIALALVSKNNENDVVEVFEANPSLPLRWADFACHYVNWQDKPVNLSRVAADINVGLDTVTFADDNPFECDLVCAQRPEAAVIHLDGPARLFPRKILNQGNFYSVALTTEDKVRAEGFSAERARKEQMKSVGDKDQFLQSLQLKLSFSPPRESELERVAQLMHKTNQFNLTTKRYGVPELLDLFGDDSAELRVARLSDRYGDYGIIGVSVSKACGGEAREIDSLLLSCRVLGRDVEHALLSILETGAREAGARYLVGRYVATAKNKLVSDLYSKYGFVMSEEEGVYQKDLKEIESLEIPSHIEIVEH